MEPKTMNDGLKKQHERAVGERFADAYRRQFSVVLTFHSQQESPDLLYRTDGGRVVGLEVVTAYYGESDAAKRWNEAREGAPRPGAVCNPDLTLRDFVEQQIAKKCLKHYEAPCWLIVDANAPLTDERDLPALGSVPVPADPPFECIFVCAARSDGAYVIGQVHRSAEVPNT